MEYCIVFKCVCFLPICLPPDANLSLAVDAYNVAESDGNVSVCAVLLGGELAREVAINTTTTETVGTATGMSINACILILYLVTTA